MTRITIDTNDLITNSEIAEQFSMSRQYVTHLTNRWDFPPPVFVLPLGRVWRKKEVEKFMRERKNGR